MLILKKYRFGMRLKFILKKQGKTIKKKRVYLKEKFKIRGQIVNKRTQTTWNGHFSSNDELEHAT